jgi:DNA-binding MarR family transcriptional regulator
MTAFKAPLTRAQDDGSLDDPSEMVLREGAELMFFGYRSFTQDPDKILAERDYGRAHHRALHFIGRQPGLSVAELLDILGVTKQSLARVLKPLVDAGLVEQRIGENDRRQRLLFLTEDGFEFEERLSAPQRARLTRAFREAGPEAVEGFRAVLELMMDAEQRKQALTVIAGAKSK